MLIADHDYYPTVIPHASSENPGEIESLVFPLDTKQHSSLISASWSKAQQAKAEDFYDNSFLQTLEASGYIISIYAR